MCKRDVNGSFFAVAFNGNKGIPEWVSYKAMLGRTIDYTGGSTQTLDRTGSQFYMDPELKAYSIKQAVPYTYEAFNNLPGGGKYAKGHYIPSHASRYNPPALDASFSFANAAPQHPSMNSGVWSNIEGWVQQGALANKTLIVITGTYGRAYTNHVGINYVSEIGPFPDYKAAIPAAFYKVIYQPATNEAIAFLAPNIDTTGDGTWANYVITVNDLENRMKSAALHPPFGKPQQNYWVTFPLPPGANKDWPTGDIHWPGANGQWPDGKKSRWYDYNASGIYLKPYPQSRTATFPGI